MTAIEAPLQLQSATSGQWGKFFWPHYGKDIEEKSQNCVKAAIAFVCTNCKRQLLFALMQVELFFALLQFQNNVLTNAIVNFHSHYFNYQRFMEYCK